MRSTHPLARRVAITGKAARDETFVVYATNRADDAHSHLRMVRRFLGQEPRALHYVPNTLAELTLVAAGMGMALIPASFEAFKIPNIAYRPVADFPDSYGLILVTRRNETSPAVQRFIEIARNSGRRQTSEKKTRRSKH
jgi:DNA-binding transcriptional LysR family regulator